MSARLSLLTYGGGTQSTALIHMSIDGVLPRLDGVIFADTQNEMPATYLHLDYIKARCESAGIPFVVVSQGDLRVDALTKKWPPTLPCYAVNEKDEPSRINGYTCSYDYKRRIVTAAEKRLCGARGAWKRSHVEQWVGYTTDEVSRCKQDDECRCGHKRAPTLSKRTGRERGHAGACRECSCQRFDPWRTNRWPLIELGMRRGDATRWISEHGYPVPARSACYFCPNRGNGHWRMLKATDPERWANAVELDEHQRTGIGDSPAFRVKARYLHGSRVPLAEADLRSVGTLATDRGQESLFDVGEIDNDCDLGTCFT